MLWNWIPVLMAVLNIVVIYFACVRNTLHLRMRYSSEFCELFLLKKMLPDNHCLEFMFRGLPRNQKHPRLFWPCISTFASIISFTIIFFFAVFLSLKRIDYLINDIPLFPIVSIGSIMIIDLVLLAIPAVQNHHYKKEMNRSSFGFYFQCRAEIEKKWPGFYNDSKWNFWEQTSLFTYN